MAKKFEFADGKKYELKDVYHVTAKFIGKKIYGIVEHYSEEAKNNWKLGFVVVADAITPQRYSIPVCDVTPVQPNMGVFDGTEWSGCDEVTQFVMNEAKKQTEFDEKNYNKFIVGRSFSVGVADGSATYVLTKVNKKTVHIEWRGFCMDRWTDHHFGYGGKFPRKEIEQYVSLHKPLFGRKQ
jgi:hypothetical protein